MELQHFDQEGEDHLLAVQEEHVEDRCGHLFGAVVHEYGLDIRLEGRYYGNLEFVHDVLEDWVVAGLQHFDQEVGQDLHFGSATRVDPSPAVHFHHVDQHEEGVVFILHVLEDERHDEADPLAVLDLGVEMGVGVDDVEQRVEAGGWIYREGLVPDGGPGEILFDVLGDLRVLVRQTFEVLVDVGGVFEEREGDLVLAQSEGFVELLAPLLVQLLEHLELKIVEIADDSPYFGSQIYTIRLPSVFLHYLIHTQFLWLLRFDSLGVFELGNGARLGIRLHQSISFDTAFVIYGRIWKIHGIVKRFLCPETEAGLRSLNSLTTSLEYRFGVFFAVFIDNLHALIRNIPILLLDLFIFLGFFVFFEAHGGKLKGVKLVPFGYALTDFLVTILKLDFPAIVITRNIRYDGPTKHPFFENSIPLFFKLFLLSFFFFLCIFFNLKSGLS